MKKLKTYRLSISRVFPATHQKRGEETNFKEKIQFSLMDIGKKPKVYGDYKIKMHTCRAGYDLWKKRIDEVNAGKAVLIVFEWSGKPYRSRQADLFRFDKDSGIGVQQLVFQQGNIDFPRVIRNDNTIVSLMQSDLAKSDGLSLQDFKDWFKKNDLNKHMAIIQFTNFRY